MVSLVEREQGPVAGGGMRRSGSVRTEVDVVRRGFGGLFSKPGTTAASAVLAALIVVSSVLVLRSEARSEVLPDLSDGKAWLRSTAVGYLSLVDGASGKVIGSFDVARAEDDFDVQANGSDAILVNDSTHTIRRMLARTWGITERIEFDENVLDVLVGEQRSWMIKAGSVSSLDLDTAELGPSVAVGPGYDDGHVNRDGTLYFGSSEADEAPLVIDMVDGEARPEPIDGLDGPVEFAELEDTTVVVDHDGLVWTESSGMVCDDLQIGNEGVVAAGGFDRLLVVTTSGVAFFWDPRSEECPTEPHVDLGPSKYGQPAVGDGWAVVPDLESGELHVILPDGGSKPVSPPSIPPGAQVELTVENNTIWFNDPKSAAAGVVHDDGGFTETVKYRPGEGVITPQPAEEDDVTRGQGNQVQGNEGEDTEALTEEDPAVADDGDKPSPEDDSADATTATTVTGTSSDRDEVTPPTSMPPVDGPAGPTTSPALPPVDDPTASPPTSAEASAIRIEIAQSDVTPMVGTRVRYQAQTMEGAPVRWEWSVNPDDGVDLASANDFWYTYGAAGSHTVRVTACDAQDRCDEASRVINVVPENATIDLVAAFTSKTTAQAAESVSFESTSQGDPDRLEWTFEGGSPGTATGARVNASWSAPGSYRVTLRVTRGQESHSAQKTITITPPAGPPPFGVSCSPGTIEQGRSTNCSLQGDAADFTNLSLRVSPDAPVSNAGSGQFVVTPGSDGSYTVTLTGNDAAGGAPRSATATVTVQSAPPPEEIVASVTGPTTLAANVAGDYVLQVDSGTVGTTTWYCGSSTSSGSGSSVRCTWSTAGSYVVRAQTTIGGSFTLTVNVTAPQAPPLSIRIDGPTSVVAGQTLNLTGTVLAGTPTSWSWNTNGGTPASATIQNVSVSWAAAGSYNVTLTASANGVSASDTHSVTVTAPPVPHDVTLVSTLPEPTDFTLTVTANGCASVSWTVPEAGLSYGPSGCLADHALSPRTNVTLVPSTSYTVNATFTFSDGHQEVRQWSVTTTAGATPADPVVSTSWSPSGAEVTVTMTSDVCTVISNAWFSSTDGGTEHSEFFPSSACQISRSYTFTRQTDASGNFRPYRINVTYSLPDGSWSKTTVDNL